MYNHGRWQVIVEVETWRCELVIQRQSFDQVALGSARRVRVPFIVARSSGSDGHGNRCEMSQRARAVFHRSTLLRIWSAWSCSCLLYTSDAADDLLCVDLGGRRIIKKKK